MTRPAHSFVTLLAGLLVTFGASAEPIYKSADFAGGLNSVTSAMKTRLSAAGYDATLFNCVSCSGATPVGGHVVFDSSLTVPAVGTVNVFSIGAIPTVPNSTIFEVDIDGLSFFFGDPTAQGTPFFQYRNGAFNGFVFVDDFDSPNGTPLRFRMEGPTFSLRTISGNAILFTGSLDVVTGLTNVRDFSPDNGNGGGGGGNGVPEPGGLALLGIALAGLVVVRRRRH